MRDERDKSIAPGGYLNTCRDYRLSSLNFGKNAEVLRNIPGQHPKINSKSLQIGKYEISATCRYKISCVEGYLVSLACGENHFNQSYSDFKQEEQNAVFFTI